MRDRDVWLNALKHQILLLSKQGLDENWAPPLAGVPKHSPPYNTAGTDHTIPSSCLLAGTPGGGPNLKGEAEASL